MRTLPYRLLLFRKKQTVKDVAQSNETIELGTSQENTTNVSEQNTSAPGQDTAQSNTPVGQEGTLIGHEAALNIALTDAKVDRAEAFDIDVELEVGMNGKWYEVEFESGNLEYDYKIQAETSDILLAKTEF